MNFKEINVRDLKINPMNMFGKDWALIAAGNQENGCNAMTIAWGQFGAVWDRNTNKGKMIVPVATVYIRPQRYTKKFFDQEDLFTISFFSQGNQKMFGYMGSHSGMNEDKIANAGLTAMFLDHTVSFQEASMIFVCRKIYHRSLQEDGFTDNQIILQNYPKKDFHKMYVGEILKIYEAD